MSRLPPGIDQTASVLARDASTGKYTTVLTTGLRCRLAHLGLSEGTVTGPERRDLASTRALIYDPAYTLPETAQVRVDGVFAPDGVTLAAWNCEAGSVAIMRGPSGRPIFGRAVVVKAS